MNPASLPWRRIIGPILKMSTYKRELSQCKREIEGSGMRIEAIEAKFMTIFDSAFRLILFIHNEEVQVCFTY